MKIDIRVDTQNPVDVAHGLRQSAASLRHNGARDCYHMFATVIAEALEREATRLEGSETKADYEAHMTMLGF